MKSILLPLLGHTLVLSLPGAKPGYFPYGGVPRSKPDIALSQPMERVYENHPATQPPSRS